MTIQAKMIAALLVAIILAVLSTLGAQHYIALRDKAALADTRGEVITATSGIAAAADKADVQRGQLDITVSQARADSQQQLEQVKRNEPMVRDRADRIIPDSLRQIAHQRRLARERSGSTGERREAEPAGANTAER